MMELVNAMYEALDAGQKSQEPMAHQPPPQHPQPRTALRQAVEILVLLLSPFAPHLCEELWERLGHPNSLAHEPWPACDPSALEESTVLLVVQVNGKLRARITVPAEASEEQLRAAVLEHEQVKKFVNGRSIKQCIVVPKRLVNIVV
ncbi:MAG: class I tRNA ligase family protein [Candidatus Omnitrophica bacterium]|nr:class I tRNA ligase family protein [Candidatus Omnitrophota bacterium]